MALRSRIRLVEAVEEFYSQQLKVGAVSIMTENKSEPAKVKGAVKIIPELNCRGAEREREFCLLGDVFLKLSN